MDKGKFMERENTCRGEVRPEGKCMLRGNPHSGETHSSGIQRGTMQRVKPCRRENHAEVKTSQKQKSGLSKNVYDLMT